MSFPAILVLEDGSIFDGIGFGIEKVEIGEIVYDNFEITLNQSINQGEEIIFKYVLNNGLYEEEILVSKIYGEPQIIFEDESENYNEYWTDNSEWSITYEEYSSPQSSITDSPYSNYSNNSEEIIELINSCLLYTSPSPRD